jgi:hypothetical protein
MRGGATLLPTRGHREWDWKGFVPPNLVWNRRDTVAAANFLPSGEGVRHYLSFYEPPRPGGGSFMPKGRRSSPGRSPDAD